MDYIVTEEENFSILNVLSNIDIFARDETLASYAESIFDFTHAGNPRRFLWNLKRGDYGGGFVPKGLVKKPRRC